MGRESCYLSPGHHLCRWPSQSKPKTALSDPAEDVLLSEGGTLGSLSLLEDVKMGAGQPHEEWAAMCKHTSGMLISQVRLWGSGCPLQEQRL